MEEPMIPREFLVRATSLALALIFASTHVIPAQEAHSVFRFGAPVKVASAEVGFAGTLADNDQFGGALAQLGDLNGDGVPDLSVGAWGTGSGRGAVWILFMDPQGLVAGQVMIGPGSGGFGGALDTGDHFGFGVAGLSDVDGDGVLDLAVGANGDDDGGTDRGAVWILFLNGNGTVRTQQKLSSTTGG